MKSASKREESQASLSYPEHKLTQSKVKLETIVVVSHPHPADDKDRPWLQRG